MYYSVAQLWKIFGKDESIYRIFNALILFIGLFCLFKTLVLLIKDVFWSMVGAAILFTSPVLAFYGNNFLMDTTAFSCSLIACYFTSKFAFQKKNQHLIFALVFFTIAGLLKISSLFIYFALIGCLILAKLNFIKNTFSKNEFLKIVSGIILSFLTIIVWYIYARYYNENNLQYIFLLGVLPIWELNYEGILEIAKKLYNNILPQVFNTWLLWIFLLIQLILLLSFHKLNKFYACLMSLLSIGVLFFILLFYQVFDVHDYYLTNA